MNSIGIYIVAHEFMVFLGLHDHASTLQGLLYDLYQNKHVDFHTLILSGVIVTIILLGKKLAPQIPWYLLIIVISILATWFFHFKIDTVGKIPSGFPKITAFPASILNMHLIIKLLPIIFTIFFITLLQSMSISQAFSEKYHDKNNVGFNLIALSFSNFVSGFTNGAPIIGSASKTAVLSSCKHSSQISNFFAALLIGIVLLWLTKLFMYLPVCVISSVVFVIGISMIDIKKLLEIRTISVSEFWLAIIIMGLILFIGIAEGLFLGIMLTLLNQIRKTYVLKSVTSWFSKANELSEKLLIYHSVEDFYYASAMKVKNEIENIIEKSPKKISMICISLASVFTIDVTSLDIFSELNEFLSGQDIQLVFSDANNEMKGSAEFKKLVEILGCAVFYDTSSDAVAAYNKTN